MTIDNPLVTTVQQAQMICDNMQRQLSSRDEYELEIKRDMRIEPWDIVLLEKKSSNENPLSVVQIREINTSLTDHKQKVKLRESLL